MEKCTFCKIVKGEIPADKVYEDNEFLSFLTIGPVSFGHILLIPKEHLVWMQEAPDEMLAKIFQLSKKLMQAMKTGIGCDYVLVSVAGKDVPHFHIHLIPRHLNDNLPDFPAQKYKDEEKLEVVKKITGAF